MAIADCHRKCGRKYLQAIKSARISLKRCLRRTRGNHIKVCLKKVSSAPKVTSPTNETKKAWPAVSDAVNWYHRCIKTMVVRICGRSKRCQFMGVASTRCPRGALRAICGCKKLKTNLRGSAKERAIKECKRKCGRKYLPAIRSAQKSLKRCLKRKGNHIKFCLKKISKAEVTKAPSASSATKVTRAPQVTSPTNETKKAWPAVSDA